MPRRRRSQGLVRDFQDLRPAEGLQGGGCTRLHHGLQIGHVARDMERRDLPVSPGVLAEASQHSCDD
ncbi:hypothetical protein D3C81_2032100 [compost metagenome]